MGALAQTRQSLGLGLRAVAQVPIRASGFRGQEKQVKTSATPHAPGHVRAVPDQARVALNGGNAPQACQDHAGASIWRALCLAPCLLLALALLAGQAAHAEGLNLPPETWTKDWTTADTGRQSALTALLVVDWGQTLYVAEHPRIPCFKDISGVIFYCANLQENGFARYFIGTHPSVGKVNNYFAASIIGHAMIAYVLPSAWRHGWQYVWIGAEANTVERNRHIGIKIDF
jgi:hypothetical protein